MLTTVRERLREIAVRAGLAGVPEPVILAVAGILVVICAFAAVRAVRSGPAATSDVTVETGAAAGSSSASGKSTAAPGGTSATGSVETTVVVHVAGKVHQPGLYRLAGGARAADAVAAAGGALPDADLGSINLARPVKDGEQLVVPAAGATPTSGQQAPSSAGPTGGSGPPATTGGLVDLNTADEAALDALPGVGPSTAKRIVEDRATNGQFKSVEDLMRVSGIGPKKFDSLKDLVTVQ